MPKQKLDKFEYKVEQHDYNENLILLVVTYNGNQYNSIRLPKVMLEAIISELLKHG